MNKENFRILQQGVDEWNKWKRLQPMALFALNEEGYIATDISDAKCIEASLYCVDFIGADLRGVDFCCADLRRADLSESDLRGADLGEADLRGANLNGANLAGADVDRAMIAGTVFANNDLREVVSLDRIDHYGRSQISTSTISRSEGKLPEYFLRGCGLKDWEIEAAKFHRTDLSRAQVVELTYKVIELRSDPLIQFDSCFISYTSKDQKFAERLYADLQNKGVRCWYAPEDLKIGEKIRVGIDESIWVHDKLLLILSKNSIDSDWVEKEVETALERERRQKRTILLPIRLDDAALSVESGWAADVRRARNIGDFRQWKSHDSYGKAFERLLRDLRAER